MGAWCRLVLWAALGGAAACSAPVRVGVAEAEADGLLDALTRAGIAARVLPSTDSARVAPGQASFDVLVAIADAKRGVALAQSLPSSPVLGPREPSTPPLFATPAQLHAALLERRQQALATTLEGLPGVDHARVHLALAPPGTPLDRQAEPVTAAVTITSSTHRAPDAEGIQQLTAAAVQGLEPERVHVEVISPPEATAVRAPGWVWIGPFAVAAGSASALRWSLAAALTLHAGLALALIALLRRARRAQP